MFIDKAKIVVKAGKGGDGCTSFYRDRRIRRGKPNGGPGGCGGDIIFEANPNFETLYDFKYNRYFHAEDGTHGSSNTKKGRNGEDLVIKVPPGTTIIEYNTNLVLKDLTEPFQKVTLCRGGKGGRGNNRNSPGTKGENPDEKTLLLELRIIADVGIIGYPNAGKSTLICKISAARSKVAAYPFTTKEPVLGVVRREEERLVVADVPGLIKGAHEGRGLGYDFLRHIERTRFLLHLIDMAAVDQRDPVADYKALNEELKLYGKQITEKGQIIVGNKMDLPEAKANIKIFKRLIRKKVYTISALTGEGVEELIDALFKKMRKYG